jgi:phage terminase small subunit
MGALPQITQQLPLRQLETPQTSSVQSTEELPNLTRKQKKYIEKRVEGLSPSKAAVAAGYSPSVANVAWTSIESNSLVKKEINRRVSEVFRGMELETSNIIDGIRHCAEWNILDYVERDPENPNKVYFDLRNVSRAQAEAIQSVGYDSEGRLKVTLTDKKAYKELLFKAKRIGESDSKHPMGVDGAPLTISALDAIVSQYRSVTIHNTTINVTGKEKEVEVPFTIDAQ